MYNFNFFPRKLIKLSAFCIAMSPAVLTAQSIDQIYSQYFSDLKQHQLAKLTNQDKLNIFNQKYQICSEQSSSITTEIDYVKNKIKQLQKKLKQGDSFAELDLMSLTEKHENLISAKYKCDTIIDNASLISAKFKQEYRESNQKLELSKQKVLDFALNEKSLNSKTVEGEITYPCASEDTMQCKSEAKATLLKELSEKRSLSLTSSSVINNFMLESDKVAITSEAKFESVEYVAEEVVDTNEGKAYMLKAIARFETGYSDAEKANDKAKLVVAIENYLSKLEADYKNN
ncbi:hypothetical protein [Catenovulum maritimum]|uniref:Uncharacterized protein n=1 Tax=Catenovulum maritimum TaxID=1513271 RepID=A0A0J8JN08_9ALTE|nr:hypothetical protein [Catenovulum maritimum]KMT65996.1 hypothetical protein XM47_05955 [Catenovulum maritimum]